MGNKIKMKTPEPVCTVERAQELKPAELNDLCESTENAIKAGGGFGWVKVPERATLERYWRGVLAMPTRILLIARLDGVVCGSCQLVRPAQNNEAQSHAIQLTTHFMAPWARGHGLAAMLLKKAEELAREEGYSVINLDVRETMDSAIKLYESQGFERIGIHPYYAVVDGQTLRGFYYCKSLK